MFVVWGALHAGYLIVEHAVRRAFGRVLPRGSDLTRLGLALLTFVVISITWVFFRAPNLAAAGALLRALFSATGTGSVTLGDHVPLLLLTLVGLLAWHWVSRDTSLEQRFSRWPVPMRATVIAVALLGTLYSGGGEQHAFIYFQF